MVTKGDVATIVYKYVAKNTVFTVANVVAKLRARGFYCSYNEVKGLVAELMESIGNYVSSSIAKPAIPQKVEPTKPTAISVQSITQTAKVRKPAKIGNRGRVWINLKNIVKPGGSAVIYQYQNELEIVEAGLTPNLNKPKPMASYVYNADDTPGIKIPNSIIESAFGKSRFGTFTKVLYQYVYPDRVVLRKK